MINLAALILGYLIGSFPTAYLLAKAQGKNVFDLGSGSMGAMNTARNLNPQTGIAVLLIDLGKGLLAVGLSKWLTQASLLPMLAATLGVIAGHAWSVYVGFRGGKALATTLGAALIVFPYVGISALACLIAIMIALRKRPSFAAIIAVACFPIITALVLSLRGESGSSFIYKVATVVLFSLLIIYKHLPDLIRELTPPSD
ncbi:MAG: glycerol-3-phosphate acyltransferase [Trueperaceae bacterium]|nr:glycerol-3-phosphate acyltransferase [Trueperaceae bacterium]